MANGSTLEGSLCIDDKIEVKRVELKSPMVEASQELLKDFRKDDGLEDMVTVEDNADGGSKVNKDDRVGLNDDDNTPWVGMVFRTRLILVCSRGGRGRADACYRARQTAKTNCEAMIAVKLWGDGLLHVVEAKLEHNHPVSPSTAQYLRCYQKMAHTVNFVQPAGHRNSHIVDKDCGNMTEIGRLRLGEGDDEAIHQFFARMQNKNPKFFYSVDLDSHGRMRNLFWADSRSRAACQFFSDVITFDTICLTERFDLPLVSFIGVNHHGQKVLLGCGLLSNETVETYTWLFKTWLTCMMNRNPNTIITDQCKAIQDAIAQVLPETRHRICLYNILKNMPEKLRGHTEFKAIKKEMKKLAYDSLRADEFEMGWKKMIKEFGLEGHEWLMGLYDNRHLWVPLFLKDTFWAGMSVAHRGDSTSSYFDGCLYPRTTLKHFFGKFEVIVQSKHKKEEQADTESFHKTPLMASKYYMEEQLSKLYTINMFQKFQDELKSTMYCHVSPIRTGSPIHVFNVKECSYMENAHYSDDIVPNNILERHDYLSMRFLQLVEVGFLSEDRYQLAMKLVRELERSLLDNPVYTHKQPRLLSFEPQSSEYVEELLASQFGTSEAKGRPQKKVKESNAETMKRTNKEQDFLSSSLLENDTNLLQDASASLHQNAHIGSHGSIDLMEEVNPNELSFGTHFGLHISQQHMDGQAKMQPSNMFQVQYDQQALGTSARMPWHYQMYQDDQILKAPTVQRNE
ncbi:hypothetical protein HPP92_013206 [Vanilla planifolia]|uniref:Protein FAR1-RELATED SEQUENCE n=1 Tax=Vanilla planifolia TaxID=51239 RepID=A0A835R1I0_VANPL|nr:hypothetical protein HPP92_013206 [Vanilla planifolia]